jgi:multiple sugar transport system substrate-binding protein
MKKFIGLLSVAGAALALASCGGNNRNVFQCPENFDTETPVTIRFWHTMGQNIRDVLDEVITEFNEIPEYSNITIEHEQIGGYPDVRDQILKNLGTGDYANLAYCYPDHVALYNEAGISIALDDLLANEKFGLGGSEIKFDGPVQEDYVETFFAESRVFGDGLAYTMPFLKSTEALFYNKTFFTQHNLKVPTTWEEMWETCARIKEIDPNSTPLGYDSEANLFITLAETYGYPYTSNLSFDFNNEGMRSLMKTFKEKYDLGYFTTENLYGSFTNTLMTDVSLNSRAYMCIGSTAGATYQANKDKAFETGCAAVPFAANGKAKVISQGPSLVLLNTGDDQATLASWIFTQYLNTPTVQARFALATGYLPVTNPATEVAQYQTFLNGANGTPQGIAALSTIQAIAQTDNYFTSATFVGSSTARDQAEALFVKIMSDKTSTDLDAAIKGYFDESIEICKYQAGLS